MDHESFDKAAFGRGVVRRRKALGWTAGRLAEKAELADPYVRRLEAGQGTRLGVDVILKLAGALGAKPDELLADAGVETSVPITRELNGLYQELGSFERRALLQTGRTLRELQANYEVLQAETPERYETDEPDVSNLAAHPVDEETREEKRFSQDWTDEEAP